MPLLCVYFEVMGDSSCHNSQDYFASSAEVSKGKIGEIGENDSFVPFVLQKAQWPKKWHEFEQLF